jgi:general secretion pathway protein E
MKVNNRPDTSQIRDLAQGFIDAGLITYEQLESARKLQRQDGGSLSQILVKYGFCTADDSVRLISIQLNIPLIDLTAHKIPPDVLRLVPEELARKYEIIPLDVIGNTMIIVMADPYNIMAIGELAQRTSMLIQPAMAVPDEVRHSITLHYTFSGLVEDEVNRFVTDTLIGQPSKQISLDRLEITEAPVVRLVDFVIREGVASRASDIHLQPQGTELRVRYRIDGILHDVSPLPLSTHQPLVSRIKVMANMDITERRRSQGGQFSYVVDGKELDIRVATFNTVEGELAVLRLLDKTLTILQLSELGFLPEALDKYQHILQSPWGMIVVSGPTGSGKTTTLYASLHQMDKEEKHVITIEDPVEYRFDKVSASEVNPKAGITFAGGLRNVLRIDPDVIMVGEIRDSETAQTAVQAALTGHLVLSSIHANDTTSTIFRLMHLGVEPLLVSSTLIGIVAQRMVRRVCHYCQVSREPKAEERIAYQHEMDEEPEHVYHGLGCNFCSETGYLGRTGVFEILLITEGIKNLVLEGADPDTIRAQAIKEGMMTMRHDGMIKVKQGITTPYEVLRSVYSIS